MQLAIKKVIDWVALNDPSKPLNLSLLHLHELLPIPSTCQELWCDENRLTSLPELPNCRTLYCYNNLLTSLPELPNCTYISCFGNKLTTLPNLPKCIEVYCVDNQLTHLSQLPECVGIHCHHNKYLHINKHQAKRFTLKETPNYNKYATIIQKNYRNYLRKKYYNVISQHLFKGPSKLVCLYSI